jgi:uncharacterized membrane protein
MILSIICLLLAVVIEVEKTQFKLNYNNICSAITGTNGCETVQSSTYSRTFGISNTYYGMLGFSLLIIFSAMLLKKKNWIIHNLLITGCIASGLMALWFLYAQAFLIHAYCLFCVIVDIISIGLFGISIYMLIKHF